MLLVFAVAALCSLRTSRTPAHERLALVLIEICVVTPSTRNSLSADLRSFVEVYLMAVIVLLGAPARAVEPQRGMLFSRFPFQTMIVYGPVWYVRAGVPKYFLMSARGSQCEK